MGKMRYITLHWTAGTYKPTEDEKLRYHFLIDGNGIVHHGRYHPENNTPPLDDGRYAAHAHLANSYNIGISLCGMKDYRGPYNPGTYPITRKQGEAAFKLMAELCQRYDIPVDTAHVFTHYELGLRKPNSLNAGKIDINYLPWEPQLKPNQVGDHIRRKVRWYLTTINPTAQQKPSNVIRLRDAIEGIQPENEKERSLWDLLINLLKSFLAQK